MRKSVLAIPLLSLWAVIALADPQPKTGAAPAGSVGAPSAAATASLEEALKTLDRHGPDKKLRYIAAFHDLDGDGIPEAIVYPISSYWCGSGGCTLFVLKQAGGTWTEVSRSTISRPPIYVLSNVANGWHSLGVWVQGGGIQPGYEAQLDFDGHSYPLNPSVPPAQRLAGTPEGQVVIAGLEGAKFLYPPMESEPMTGASAGSVTNEKPKECHTGPVTQTYGGTLWSVYSCGDDTSLLFVAMTNTPAAPFYFVMYLKDGKYQYDGEGTGSKQATDAAYLDLLKLSSADVATLVAETRSTYAAKADAPAVAMPPRGSLPFTKAQNLDGARFVWYVFQKADLGYDYVTADALPASLKFREETSPRNGDVAWWPGYVALVSMKPGEPMQFITAEAVRGEAVMEAIYGKPRFFTPMQLGPCADPQTITAANLAGSWVRAEGVATANLQFKGDGTFSGWYEAHGSVTWRYAGTWKLDGHMLTRVYTASSAAQVPVGFTEQGEVVLIGCQTFAIRMADGNTQSFKRTGD